MISKTAQSGLAVLLAVVAALPADPKPPSPASPGGAQLVPGVPLPAPHPWQRDTPDQDLPPRVYTPSAAEDAVEPEDAVGEQLVEYVPRSEVVRKSAAARCSTSTGPYQRQVERWLKLTVDGKQSAKDCRAIRAFQRKEGIRPDIGFAGPVTWARMRLISAGKKPNAAKKCPTRAYRLACVDLRRQLMWVQKGKKVVLGPVPIRSGRPGYETRVGWHKIYWKHKNHWSSIYETPMPYSQFFNGGQAFHGIYGNIYNRPGSHGCVNLRIADARALWKTLHKGDRVYAWGSRQGA